MVTIVDYIGYCDLTGEPVGHPVKVINETIELVLPFERILVAASSKHLEKVKNRDKIDTTRLNFSICVFSNKKILNLVHKWDNLAKAFNKDTGKVWFINVDFSLFLYLFLHPNRNDISVITLCYNPIAHSTGWRRRIVTSVLKRAFLVVVTNSNFLSFIPGNTIYVPDYYYNDELYEKYKSDSKIEQLVCLGTMGETKKLEELVSAFAHDNKKLIIAGNFSQNQLRFDNLMHKKTSNIDLINKRVSNDEYYHMIANTKYVVLPYDMNLYDERTSGILLETIFLHSVPIAPKELLEYNGIKGIGYDKIDDIPKLLGDEKKIDTIINENDALVRTVFSISSIRDKIKNELIGMDKTR